MGGVRKTFRLASKSKLTTLIFRLPRHALPSFPTLPYDHKLKSSRGFTIMEVALAATVLALTLTGMIEVVESGSQMLDLSRKQTIASQILDDEIHQLRLQSWTTVLSYASSSSVPISTTFSSAAQANFICTRNVSVVKTDSGGYTDLVQVQFIITWTGIAGRTYTRMAATYVSKNGLYQSFQRS
jgi:hypothetical protein